MMACRYPHHGRRHRSAPARWAWECPTVPATPVDHLDTAPALTSLIDEYPEQMTAERTSLDQLLRTIAAHLDHTSSPDSQCRLSDLLPAFARRIWRRRDPGSELAGVTVDYLVAEATWLIAYAAGTPGSDRTSATSQTVLSWLDAAPRQLRALVLRAAAGRYLD